MRVLIADPQTTVRRALSIWINGQPGWKVVGESSNALDLIDKLNQLSSDVVIIDSELPGIPLREMVARIRQDCGNAAIILLFNDSLEQFHPELLDVDYCIRKIDPPNRMLEAILKAGH